MSVNVKMVEVQIRADVAGRPVAVFLEESNGKQHYFLMRGGCEKLDVVVDGVITGGREL